MAAARLQKNIVKNMVISEVAYLLCAAICITAWTMGFVDLAFQWLFVFPVVQGLGFLVFFVMVKRGLSLRFQDPGMTFSQIMYTMTTQFSFLYFVDTRIRGVLLLVCCIPYTYAMFKVTRRQCYLLVSTIMLLQLSLVMALALWKPEQMVFSVELIRFLVLCCVFLFLTWFAAYSYGLRQVILKGKRDLEQAHEELKSAQQELSRAAHRAGMAEVAADVLHQVGHLLNSMHVSHDVAYESTDAMRVDLLRNCAFLMERHRQDPSAFLRDDPKAQGLYLMLVKLADNFSKNRTRSLNELEKLGALVSQVKSVLAVYRESADARYLEEELDLAQVVAESLASEETRLGEAGVRVILKLAPGLTLNLSRLKLSNVLRRLIRNAQEAMEEQPREEERELSIGTGVDQNGIWLVVEDTGGGLTQGADAIFRHGFSSKGARGDGLHYSANAMIEMKGTIEAENRPDRSGARFTLRFS